MALGCGRGTCAEHLGVVGDRKPACRGHSCSGL
jgi:hypothetical protein